jgi:hypothetical protein
MPESGDRRPHVAEEQAEQRRHQGAAVAALNAFSARISADARSELRFLAPEDAMRELAAAVRDGTLRVPRLFVLDALVKYASRRGEDLQAHGAARDELLEALVIRAGLAAADVGDAVATVRQALDSIGQLEGPPPSYDRWEAFALQAAGALRLTQAEIEKPQCNDTEVVRKGPYSAVGITVEFYTDATPGDLRHFCDPTRWHECSAYQREMTPWDGPGAVNIQRPNGWRRDLYETVVFSPAKTLVTPLRFTYSIEGKTDPGWVHLDYVLLAETADIVVDEGALDVRRVTSGKHAGRTLVSAKKAVLFTDPILSSWTTVACDTFWTDSVITAAVGCPDDGGGPPSQGGATMADKLDKAIAEATKSAQESVAAYATLAKEAATRLSGDAPADPGAWLQLSAKTWAQAADDTVAACKTYNEVLKILASQAESTADG